MMGTAVIETSSRGVVEGRAGRWRRSLLGPLCVNALLQVWACGGEPSTTTREPDVAQGANTPSASPGAARGSDGSTPAAVPSFPVRQPAQQAAETRLTRLTHTQYENTVQDLLGVRSSLDLTFAPDALNGFVFDTSNDFVVDARLGPQYRAMAETLADRAVIDPAIFARLVPCDPASADCPAQFISSFGERAFRRPLSGEEASAFLQLFALGAELVQSGDAFRDGARLTLEAIFQSPQFLYRTDVGAQADADGRLALDDWEIASRLSYFLYDSMPDAELFAAARAGRLHTPEQIEAETRRMLTHSRVLTKLASFHEQAWQFGRFSRISPDRASYPLVPSNFVPRVRESAQHFVADVLSAGGGLEELLTAPYAYVDDGLAPLYGRTAPAAEPGTFQRIEFAAGERQGLLMQVGYLASNSYSVKTDPIHRGLFVIRNLLCRQIPDPPPGAATTPLPEVSEPIETTREEISILTGQSYCPTCHSNINPPGFAFEGFDAVGQARTEENGVAIDTAAEMILDGQRVSFGGPGELVQLLAGSQEAHACYTSRWIEFALGRPLAQEDVATWQGLSTRSLPIADIVVQLVRSPQFSSLSPSVDLERAAEAPPAPMIGYPSDEEANEGAQP
ncbi:MAG: hypothetical protein RL033_5541 [Pseudomonadota bacterium]|jgi:hypothetical protein